MITGRQIRAARSLLDWTAADLAEKAGLTRETVSRIEVDTVQAREGSLEKILGVFNGCRIEFIDNEGVRFRPEGLEVLNGEAGVRKFLDHVYQYAQNTGGVMRQNGIEDDTFFKNAANATQQHVERMAALKRTQKNVLVRVLINEGVVDFQCPEYAEYKWFPHASPMPVPYYIFGDTVGIFAVDENTLPRIYQITSPVIATAYTKQFDSAWKAANDPLRMKRGGDQ